MQSIYGRVAYGTPAPVGRGFFTTETGRALRPFDSAQGPDVDRWWSEGYSHAKKGSERFIAPFCIYSLRDP